MSITLSASAISVKTVGGIVKETDATDAITSLQLDYQQNNLTFVIQGGTFVGQVFTPGSAGDNVQVTMDLVTGRWNASNGTSGTLGGASLTNLLTTLKGLRNTGETFAVSTAIIAGTQVAWT